MLYFQYLHVCLLWFSSGPISNFWSRRLASAIHGVVSGFCSCSGFQYFRSVLIPTVLVLCQVLRLSRGFNVYINCVLVTPLSGFKKSTACPESFVWKCSICSKPNFFFFFFFKLMDSVFASDRRFFHLADNNVFPLVFAPFIHFSTLLSTPCFHLLFWLVC